MTQAQEGSRYKLALGATFSVLFVAYLAGLTWWLPLFAAVMLFWRLPVPRILHSVIGRAFVAGVGSLVLLQFAALVQFFVAPMSDFGFVAAVFAFLTFLVVVYYGKSPASRPAWFTRYDAAGAILTAVFLAPFTPIMVGHDTVQSIVSIAGLQSPDAGHHFNFIGSMMHDQHLDTSGYPKSFHLGVGFLQDAFIGSQEQLSWKMNVVTFFAQYVLFGALLAFVLGYLLLQWLEQMSRKRAGKWASVCGAVGLSVPLALVILWPFVEHGFLNYLYMVALIGLAVLFMGEGMGAVLVLGLLLGASLTWPLVVPAVLLGLVVMLWPSKPRSWLQLAWSHKAASFLILLQLVPLLMTIYMPGTTSINDQGDLRTLTIFVILVGLAVTAVGLRRLPLVPRKAVFAVLVPFVLLTAGICAMQLFLFGQPRYFTIKVALLVEAFLLPMTVAVLLDWCRRRKGRMVLVVIAPIAVLVPLVMLSGKPFEDVRNLFRNQTGQSKPDFYDHDVYEYAALGKAGKIDYFNSTVLHYNAANKTLYSHAFLPQIAQYMKYPRTSGGLEAFACHRLIFRNITNGAFSREEQKALITLVRTCAADAQRNGQNYYIITDETSLPFVKAEVGEGRGIIYVGS